MRYSLLTMTAEHRRPVMEIYNYYIENSMAAYREEALPLEAYDLLLRRVEKHPAYVAQAEDQSIIGFGFLSAHKDMPAFAHTAEFTCFLHQDKLGAGLGSAILGQLESDACRNGISILLSHISSFNDRSIAFHQKHGFRRCGCFHGVGKSKGNIFDTIWMQKTLI